MDDADIVPPHSPTAAQQADALAKGLGRALRWAATGKLGVDLLLKACLHDLRYDWQIEPSRSPWLWEIICACDAADRLCDPIFEAFTRLSEPSAGQLCGLARHFAATGHDEFRVRLYEVVRTKPFPAMDWIGEDDVVSLDGQAGFEFVAGVRGERLDLEPWDWPHTAVMRNAIERWGREPTLRLLGTSTVPGTRRFLEAWPGEPTGPATDGRNSHRERMRAIPATDVLSAAGNPDRCIWFRGWGMNAEDDDLRAVLHAVRREGDPHRLARLLRVFVGRPLPEFDVRILELARHGDPDVRTAATRSLEPNAHPAIRDFGMELLADPNRAADAIALFVRNYAPGDEARLRTALPSVPGDDVHLALMNAEKMLDANSEADPLPLGTYAYRHTPCSHCRESVAELLHRRNVMPHWMRDELRFDSYEDGRKLAGVVSGVGATSR